MATPPNLDVHVDTLGRSASRLRRSAQVAGLTAPVPTCDGWTVADLVAHQGMVHRWAAAHLRGDRSHRKEDSLAEAASASDVLAWFSAGVDALIETIHATPDDAAAFVFLANAPRPRRFWARRQAHETTIHSVDALSAALGRVPSAPEVTISPAVAADGVDELLTGFIPRPKCRLRSDEPFTAVFRSLDTGHAWSLRIGTDHPVATTGEGSAAEVIVTGTAVELYLGLWNRGAAITCAGRPGFLEQWRSDARV